MNTSWMILFLLMVLLVSPARGDSDAERQSLKGLTGVQVVVENMQPDATRDGLKRSALQRDVEQRLRQAGIRVPGEAEWLMAPGRPTLYLHVNALKSPPGIYAICIKLQLFQTARLTRDTTVISPVITWSATETIGTISAERLSQVRNAVPDLVNQFINAYLTANPKR